MSISSDDQTTSRGARRGHRPPAGGGVTNEGGSASSTPDLFDAFGDGYFCGPAFRPGHGYPYLAFLSPSVAVPDGVRSAFEGNRTWETAVQARQNEVPQPATKPNAICQVDDAPVPAGQDYMVFKAIESCTLTIWMLPDGEGPMPAALQP